MSDDGKILGVSDRWLPAPPMGLQRVRVVVVLVAGAIGDYAAYIGAGPPEFVKRHGDKISFEEASSQFPGQLEKERYRA
jgi:hypothetical protein